MLISDYKIYYSNKNFDEPYENWSAEEREEAKKADVILSKDGRVIKDRFDGRRFKE